MKRVITLLTDIGERYASEMKGVILQINSDANIVDITHNVSPYNVIEGAFLLKSAISHYPNDSVHIGVVDPGVGTDRRGIIIEAEKTCFVGPDNGLLIPAARLFQQFRVFEITKKFPDSSYTFHGRDIFSPIAAQISKGKCAKDFGKKIEDFVDIDVESFKINKNSITGKVVHIDHFGSIVTSIPYESVCKKLKYGDNVSVLGKKLTFSRTYGEVKVGEPLLLLGSQKNIEVSINQNDASKFFKVKAGDSIKIDLLERGLK